MGIEYVYHANARPGSRSAAVTDWRDPGTSYHFPEGQRSVYLPVQTLDLAGAKKTRHYPSWGINTEPPSNTWNDRHTLPEIDGKMG
jgi:hypothetical protein